MAVSLWTVLVQLHAFAGPILMLVYPLYASIMAIESPFKEDDTQWLTYWVLYSFFSLIELGFDRVLAWIPMWYTLKLACICWLVLPQFRGAAYVYDNFVRKHISVNTSRIEAKLTPQQRHVLQMMSPSARNSVAAFINDNGTDAFDKIIHNAIRKQRSPATSPSRWGWSSHSDGRHEGSPTSDRGYDYGQNDSDEFGHNCRHPTKLLKTGLHQLEKRRRDIRARFRTHFVA